MYTSKYIFSILLLVSFSVFSQQKEKEVKQLQPATVTDTATTPAVPVIKDRYGLRVGIDLHRLSRSFYLDGFRGIEAVADYRLTKKMYAAAEVGNLKYTIDDAQLNFTTSGSYMKVGIDLNAYENWLDMENMVYIGFRYGFSSFSQNLNSYKIYQNTNIDDTGNYLDEVTVQTDKKYGGLTAHWVEVVGGVKAKLFNNLFLGFSVRLNGLVANTKPEGFDNLYIPGFNRTYDGNFGVGFNYTLSYLIPLYKKEPAAKESAPAKKKKK